MLIWPYGFVAVITPVLLMIFGQRSGVRFPQRSPRSAPVITPPVSHQSKVAQIGFGMPANSSRRLDEAMSSEVESLRYHLKFDNLLLFSVYPWTTKVCKVVHLP